MLKKALLWDENRNQIEPRTGFLQLYVKTKKVYKKSKLEEVPTFVWLFRDDATTAKGPVYDEGTNLCLHNFAVVPLMPFRGLVKW